MIPTYTPATLRAVLTRHAITGSRAAHLLAVDSRTIRKWTAPEGTANHRQMPESAWWLLLILLGDLTAAELLTALSVATESADSG